MSQTPPSSPQPKARRNTYSGGKAELTVTTSPDWNANRPVYPPPDTLKESLYSVVKKPKRYPAPTIPAPPPPYEGPGPGVTQKPSSSPVAAKRSSVPTDSPQPNIRRNVTGQTSQASKGNARSMRTPPSRPSRPPAGKNL